MSTAGSPTSVALEPNIRRPKAPRMTSVRCRASTSGGGPGQTVAIIGRGRVGLAIGRMCERLDMEHVFMTRGDTSFPPHGPIYVATHASDLDDVLALVPNDRRKDLVLLQGGLLRDDWLRRSRLEPLVCGDASRALHEREGRRDRAGRRRRHVRVWATRR